MAHCQLHYNEYAPARELCDKVLNLDKENVKGFYRRSVAFTGLGMYEEAWQDIQTALKLDPNDKLAHQKAQQLKPKIEKINTEYTNVIKKMFG